MANTFLLISNDFLRSATLSIMFSKQFNNKTDTTEAKMFFLNTFYPEMFCISHFPMPKQGKYLQFKIFFSNIILVCIVERTFEF